MRICAWWVCSGELASDGLEAHRTGEALLADYARANGMQLAGPVDVDVQQAHPLRPLTRQGTNGYVVIYAPQVALTAEADCEPVA